MQAITFDVSFSGCCLSLIGLVVVSLLSCKAKIEQLLLLLLLRLHQNMSSNGSPKALMLVKARRRKVGSNSWFTSLK